jgi:adenosylcobyric acid synthase
MGALMVQGVSSSAGKSLITTGIARSLARRGRDVVPFKAQNMSNNARVVRGGEIGTAQYLQALAAGVEPDVRMNPVLVKPEGDNRSQVVILGKADLELSRLPWRARASRLWPVIESCLQELRAEHDVLIIEGAGSPAETNLRDSDLANMKTAHAADARVLLVADIDRGGAFAHLYGTWAILPEAERSLIAGFALNKFRGDPSLLPPAPEDLERRTGVPTVGVLPWLDHGLPDEDGAWIPGRSQERAPVAVVRYPTASNLDEFKLLEQVTELTWATQADQLEGAELVILPGSKHVAADLAWLKSSGLDRAVAARAQQGQRVLGICGGLQMLGERVEDEAGVDGSATGLGLLPLKTSFKPSKLVARASCTFDCLPPPWAELDGLGFSGYQIRHGVTAAAAEAAVRVFADGLGYASGAVLAVYAHGMLEEPSVLEALFGSRPRRTLEQAFDQLADAVEEHLDLPFLMRKAGIA